MGRAPTTLGELLREIVAGYYLDWNSRDGWHLDATDALIREWIAKGDVG